MKTWTESIEHRGQTYTLQLIQRPFREGLEAQLSLGQKTVRIAELGLGREALLQRVRSEVDKYLNAIEE